LTLAQAHPHEAAIGRGGPGAVARPHRERELASCKQVTSSLNRLQAKSVLTVFWVIHNVFVCAREPTWFCARQPCAFRQSTSHSSCTYTLPHQTHASSRGQAPRFEERDWCQVLAFCGAATIGEGCAPLSIRQQPATRRIVTHQFGPKPRGRGGRLQGLQGHRIRCARRARPPPVATSAERYAPDAPMEAAVEGAQRGCQARADGEGHDDDHEEVDGGVERVLCVAGRHVSHPAGARAR
jgi:hypothetical protein